MQHFLSIFLIRIDIWFTATQMNNSFNIYIFYFLISMLLLFSFSHCDSFFFPSILFFLLENYYYNLRDRIEDFESEHETCSTPERVQYWLDFTVEKDGKRISWICIVLLMSVDFFLSLLYRYYREPRSYYVKALRQKKYSAVLSRLLSIANLWTRNTIHTIDLFVIINYWLLFETKQQW